MRKAVLSVGLLFIALSLLGCGFFYSVFPTPGPTPIPTNPALHLPKLSGDWLVRLAQSGGIAGVSRSLEISSSGAMTIIETRGGERKVSQLPAEKLAALNELVAASTFRPASLPTGCADCFVFDLRITSADGTFQAQLDEVSLPDSGLQSLLDFLAGLLNNTGG